jgi:hypothetical protein
MAPTIKWQRWDSASYDWFGKTADDALPRLEEELDAWMTAVNGNASNVGRQVTKERGSADSTGGNYAALVMSCGANGNTEKGYLSYGCFNSTSSKRIYAGPTYADDTSNNGYGTISGGSSDTSVSWYTSGQEASWLLVYDVTDGQEYFSFGPTFGAAPSNTYQDGFFIFKGNDGEWSITSNDASSQHHVHYWDDAISTGWSNCSRSSDPDLSRLQGSYSCGRYLLYSNSVNQSNSTNAAEGSQFVFAANPDVYETTTNFFFSYTGRRRVFSDLGDGNNVYMLTGYYYGPSFLIDLRS